MIVEEITFRSLITITATPVATNIHRYKDVYFAIAHIGDALYIAIARDAPKEKAPYIEYDMNTRKWRFIDPAKEGFSKDPSAVKVPVIEVKELHGEVGEKIESILSR